MTIRHLIKPAVAMVAASLLTGCASVYQASQFGGFETQLKEGKFQEATQSAVNRSDVDEKTGRPTDLLWTLQAGSLMRMQKDYQRSTEFFDASENMMQNEDTRSAASNVAMEGTSLLINDAILPYQQSHYEGVMANTYKAMNFSAQSDVDNARIEWNRVYDRQRRAVEAFADEIAERQEEIQAQQEKQKEQANLNRSLKASSKLLAQSGVDMGQWQPYKGFVNPFSTYMYGLHFMLNAQSRTDFQRAYDSLKRVYSMTGNATVKKDMSIARQLMNGFSFNKVRPRVWVIYENGLAPKKKEFRIDLPIVLSSQKIVYTGIALPRLVERKKAYDYIKANGNKTTQLSDMDRIVKAEFKEQFNYILFKEIVRATAKTITQRNIAKKDSTAGLLFAVAQMATTSADTRSWTSLPKEFQLTRFKRPASGVVSLAMPGMEQSLDVNIDKNSQFNIVYVKAVSAGQLPSVEVISL
ncbi:hypothetical protein EOPP23_13440 [Endozoicomonas sp. OPT23]|uniref:COG3014 family protein n=1 Tax=Endozoicomonas sp. OPT23 TaxID=2072845 RepID=UPI00129AE3FF|nr:hypothetical protein [Endozoicomonas sp. OPT23]MRI33994.1 hypothetical protein [Endozoicomonas sp. OPT23]